MKELDISVSRPMQRFVQIRHLGDKDSTLYTVLIRGKDVAAFVGFWSSRRALSFAEEQVRKIFDAEDKQRAASKRAKVVRPEMCDGAGSSLAPTIADRLNAARKENESV